MFISFNYPIGCRAIVVKITTKLRAVVRNYQGKIKGLQKVIFSGFGKNNYNRYEEQYLQLE